MEKTHSAPQPSIGVLLVHGLNGSRRDMHELEQQCQARGMQTHNILLPGHGTHVRDLLALGWSDWAEAVHNALRVLKQQCDFVFLIGHSLGGSLSLHAAAHEEVAGVVTMCAPLHMYPWTKPIVGFMKYITPVLPTIREDIHDAEARRLYTRDVYRWTPMRPVESMLEFLPRLRTELTLVTAPALIMASIYDHVVPARDGREIYRLLGSKEKYLVTFHRSYHVLMKDHDKEEVAAKTMAFIQRQVHQAKRDITDQTA